MLSFTSSSTTASAVSFIEPGMAELCRLGRSLLLTSVEDALCLRLGGLSSLENVLGLLPPYAANSALVCEDGEGILLSSVGEGALSVLLSPSLAVERQMHGRSCSLSWVLNSTIKLKSVVKATVTSRRDKRPSRGRSSAETNPTVKPKACQIRIALYAVSDLSTNRIPVRPAKEKHL